MGVKKAGAPRHTCSICAKSRRPVGKAKNEPGGWAVYRWSQPDPLLSGLATRGEAMKVLWALKHHWSSITVKFLRGHESRIDLNVEGYNL